MQPKPGYPLRPTARDHLHRLTNVFASNPLYFITCCTADRRRIFVTPEPAGVIVDAFREAAQVHGWVVGRYVIMPDHLHFFVRPALAAKSLSAFMRDWKKWTTARLVRLVRIEAPVWQAEFFDHVIRSADSYAEKWEYVRQNPVRAGLVTLPEAWPYTGECEVLRF